MSGFEIRKGILYKINYDKDGKETSSSYVGKAIFLDSVTKNLETGEMKWHVHFKHLNDIVRCDFDRGAIADNRNFVNVLAKKGAEVTTKTADAYARSLLFQEGGLDEIKNTYTNVGWISLNTNNGKALCYRHYSLLGEVSGSYEGNYYLKPLGSLEGWTSTVINEVLGRPQLETVLLASMSAIVVGLISTSTAGENPILHICCDSGLGKTTACELAASVYGLPFSGQKVIYNKDGEAQRKFSVFSSWGATPKATISSNAGNRGIAVILNELGLGLKRDMTDVIFHLSEGTDIKRLNQTLDVNLTEGYYTSFISCGEMSLVDCCKTKLKGLNIRVLEISEKMTDDADHSNRLKIGCRKNCGWASIALADWIIENGGCSYVSNLYRKVLDRLISKHPDVDVRFLQKFPAYFLTTGILTEKAMNITFNLSDVENFCINIYKNHQKSNGDTDSSYQDIIGECLKNIGNFYNMTNNPTPKSCWGAIGYPMIKADDKVVTVEYAILPYVLKETLKKLGYPNPNTCISLWKKAGVLVYDKGHLTTKRVINNKNTRERVYVLRVFDTDFKESESDKKERRRIFFDNEQPSSNPDSEADITNSANIVSQGTGDNQESNSQAH